MSAADVPVPDDHVHGLKEAFLLCRSFGHSWRLGHRGPMAGTSAWTFELVCRSCKTTRHDVLTTTGHLLSRNYGYPDGYTFTRSAGDDAIAPTRDEYRVEIILRAKAR